MTISSWPPALPAVPERSGYARRPKPSIIALATEVGGAKRRRRSSVRVTSVECVFIFTEPQRAVFEAFFADTLDEGALPFSMVDPVRGDEAVWLFDATDPYRVEPMGATHWRGTLRLERRG